MNVANFLYQWCLKKENRGGTFDSDEFSAPVCHVAQFGVSSALAKSHGEAEEGKSLEPVFAFPTFSAVALLAPAVTIETCLKNAIVIILHLLLRAGFIEL